ncbi:MAG: class I SAM-dependent methyltransferase [Chloroflexi bacterium]|nr:class I SAM-dependent methyltransferase [Chloroflexota bacterium]
MSLQYHEISEARHRILDPFTDDKLMLLGEVCRLRMGMTMLDLACGKGETLCRWAQKWGITGVGVDISKVFIPAARARAQELGVANRVKFVEGDASQYPQEQHEFDIVSCLGATWIGGGLVGTLELMKKAVKGGDSLILVGEPYWIEPPPPEAADALGVADEDYTSLIGTLDRIESVGLELIEMVLADPDSWDRYEAGQWQTISDWLRENPEHHLAPEMRAGLAANQRAYLQYGRRYFGWGVFVTRPV